MPEGNSSGYLVELDAVYNRSGTVDDSDSNMRNHCANLPSPLWIDNVAFDYFLLASFLSICRNRDHSKSGIMIKTLLYVLTKEQK